MAQPHEATPPPRWMVRMNRAMLRRGLKVGAQHLSSVRGRRTGELSDPDAIAAAADRYPVFRVDAIVARSADRGA